MPSLPHIKDRNLFLLSPTVLLALFAAGCGDTLETTVRVVDLLAAFPAGLEIVDALDPGHPDCRPLLTEGWHAPEKGPDDLTFAWTSAPVASCMLPVTRPEPGRLLLRACRGPGDSSPQILSVSLNGRELGTVQLDRKLGTSAIPVSAEMLRSGLNEVTLTTENLFQPANDKRSLGVMVDFLRFVPEGVQVDENLDPYGEKGTHLAFGRMLRVPLFHPAGCRLDLDWEYQGTGDGVLVQLWGGAEGEALVQREYAANRGKPVELAIPASAPGRLELRIRLASPLPAGEPGRIQFTLARLSSASRAVNVVLLIVDTLRPDFLGCYGGGEAASPNIDRLAADGVLFTNAFCHIPITGPSHAALFSSRYPSELGVLNNFGARIPEGIPLLAEILEQRGWRTGGVVSIPPLDGRLGFDRGFGRYEDAMPHHLLLRAHQVLPRCLEVWRDLAQPLLFLAHFSDPHEPYNAYDLHDRWADVHLDGRRLGAVPTSNYEVRIFDLELPDGPSLLRLTSEHPFKVRTLELEADGGPSPEITRDYDPSDLAREFRVAIPATGSRRPRLILGLSDLFDDFGDLRARYAREVAHVDQYLGAFLDSLRASGQYEESLIIFTSDHAEALGERKNGVGHVTSLYDTMMHIPLIIKPPASDGFSAGSRRDDLAGLVDLLPTILARTGLPALPGARGRDLLAPAAGDLHPGVFMETHAPQAPHTLFGIRDRGTKFIHDPGGDGFELYSLKDDPLELDNHYADDPVAAADWRRRLEEWRESLREGRQESAPVTVDAATRRKLQALGY